MEHKPLDEVNRALIDALLVAPRATHRQLAQQLGANEVTVASRLRRLSESGVLASTIAVDWRAAGYSRSTYFWLSCQGRSVAAIGEEVASIEGVQNVVVVLGGADLFVHALLPSGGDELLNLRSRIESVEGAEVEHSNDVLRHYVHRTDVTQLPITEPPLPPMPAPVVALDDLDVRLCNELALDARQSNREIARLLETSERTVRARLKRLEDAGLIRIVTMVDRRVLDTDRVRAMVAVRTNGDIAGVSAALSGLPWISSLTATSGDADLYLIASGPSAEAIVDFILTDVRTVPGVRSSSTHLLGWSIKFGTRLRRFV